MGNCPRHIDLAYRESPCPATMTSEAEGNIPQRVLAHDRTRRDMEYAP